MLKLNAIPFDIFSFTAANIASTNNVGDSIVTGKHVSSHDRGVEFVFNVSPKSIKTSNGLATGVELLETMMSEPDASGRQKVVIKDGSEFVEEADVVILALGFSPEVPA